MPDTNSGGVGLGAARPNHSDTQAISKNALNKLLAQAEKAAVRGSATKYVSEVQRAVTQVYQALDEKGYDPVRQLAGYILTGEPTYITTHLDARKIICRIDREELLEEIIGFYLFEED